MQPPTAQVWYRRGPGENPIYFPPGGFRFLSPRRKEQRDCTKKYGNVHNSMPFGSVTRWLPQPLRGSSLPEGAPCTPMFLFGTA